MSTYHRPLCWDPFWLRDEHTHVRGSWDQLNMDSESGKSNWLAKGNPEDMPHMIQTTMRIPMCLSTFIVLFVLINTLLLSLFPISVEILSSKVKGQGLATDHWFSSKDLVPLPHNLWWETEALFQAAAGWGHPRSCSTAWCDLVLRFIYFPANVSFISLFLFMPEGHSRFLEICRFPASRQLWRPEMSHAPIILFKVHASN